MDAKTVLQKAMDSAGETQTTLAKKLGVTQQTVSSYFNNPTIKTLRKIKSVLPDLSLASIEGFGPSRSDVYDLNKIRAQINIKLQVTAIRSRTGAIMPLITPILEFPDDEAQEYLVNLQEAQKRKIASTFGYDVDALFMKTFPFDESKHNISPAQKKLIMQILNISELSDEDAEQLIEILPNPKRRKALLAAIKAFSED